MLKRQAHGGRSLWGFEGPKRQPEPPTLEQGRRLAWGRFGAYDSDGSTSEGDVSSHREEWKQSWRRLACELTGGGRVRGLRQVFGDREEEEEGDPLNSAARATHRGPILSRRVSFPSIASPVANMHDPPSLYYDCETQRTVRPCSDLARSCADSPGTVRLEQDDDHSHSSFDFSPSPPRPPRNARAPIPFLTTGSVLSTARTSSRASRDCPLGRADLDAEFSLTCASRRFSDSSQVTYPNLKEQRAAPHEAYKVWPSSACEGVSTGLVHNEDQQELETVRASRSPRGGGKSAKATGQYKQSLALDAIFTSDKAASSSSGQGQARASLIDNSPDGKELPTLSTLSEWQQGLQGDIDGEGTTRAKKGSLVLVGSEFRLISCLVRTLPFPDLLLYMWRQDRSSLLCSSGCKRLRLGWPKRWSARFRKHA